MWLEDILSQQQIVPPPPPPPQRHIVPMDAPSPATFCPGTCHFKAPYFGQMLGISRAYLGHTSGISRAYLKHILDISCIGIPSRMSGSTILGILTWNLLCLLASSKGYQYKETFIFYSKKPFHDK